MLRNSQHSYGLAARVFHWLSAIAVLTALFCVEINGFWPRGSAERMQLLLWHIDAGLLTALLLVPRLLWRLGNRPPVITPLPSPLVQRLAHAGHWTLYALMLLLPLFGVLTQQAGGKPVALFGIAMPAFIAPAPGLRHLWREIHGLLGNLLLIVLAIHVAAAVWHHRFLRDDTLTRLIGPQR
ncbi:cytochrome b [Vogesella sp. LIG4]|uniref:cytochrome b n=1 Tax=Vogesella sp. LIG4 TaxID=1192162 RepID=UPI00081FFDF3|nr:cytochrome b [Vogesella sp. LIG4]SCK13212.1 cytochrome b561 [Vogesella sp. LIG4]